MKKKYEQPEYQMKMFSAEDILVTSPNGIVADLGDAEVGGGEQEIVDGPQAAKIAYRRTLNG